MVRFAIGKFLRAQYIEKICLARRTGLGTKNPFEREHIILRLHLAAVGEPDTGQQVKSVGPAIRRNVPVLRLRVHYAGAAVIIQQPAKQNPDQRHAITVKGNRRVQSMEFALKCQAKGAATVRRNGGRFRSQTCRRCHGAKQQAIREQWKFSHRLFGLSTSCNPWPKRLSASTVMIMASPGAITSTGAAMK